MYLNCESYGTKIIYFKLIYITILYLKLIINLLFIESRTEIMSIPLAERMRPKSLDNYIGQSHLVGKNAILRKMIEVGHIPSMILWGPPGTGKTTLAYIISNILDREFLQLSAISSGVKDIRSSIEKAKSLISEGKQGPILFIDEIHRFNKAQQDALLGSVEQGIITLIGATTENPSFEVISALLSRCQVFVLKHLEKFDLETLVKNAIIDDVIFSKRKIKINETEALLMYSGGDARKVYNTLEIVIESHKSNEEIIITNNIVSKSIQNNFELYDKSGEQHYDIISAFIKSVRGSDPDATLYYLARMIKGGEDPKFICRRMIILAAEDVGLANPNALLIANTCFDTVHKIGLPEARIIMSQTAIYLASSPKSNSAYSAIDKALDLVGKNKNIPVPMHLRNAPTKLMKDIGYGKNYKYAHGYKGNFVEQSYLPESIKNSSFYQPQNNDSENRLRAWLRKKWKDRF